MTTRLLTEAEKETLERLIDSTSLHTVLYALAEVCGEKAEHVRTNWQDSATASTWDRDARKLAGLKVEN